MSVSLIIPALNEEASIAGVLRALPNGLYSQVIVVDNGSTDHTAEFARAAGATVVVEPRRGYGRACLAGIAALDPGADIVVFMDADSSDVPQEARALVEPIATGRADLVIGSRVLGRAERGALAVHQRAGNAVATTLLRWLYRFRYTDLGPFRAIRASSLRALAMRDADFGWTVEMQVRALQRGLRIVEVPVSYRRRIGTSKISGSLRASLAAGWKIIGTILRLRFAALSMMLALAGVALGQQQSAYPTRWSPQLAKRADVAAALRYIDEHKEQHLRQWIAITEIPAPSGMEQRRAEYVRREMRRAGLEDVRSDDAGNVWGVRKGAGGEGARVIVFAAHMDTVHPAGTPIKVRREGDRLFAPGVFDNSASVANLLAAARAMHAAAVRTRVDLVFLATVQEEAGLKGMRHWLERRQDRTAALIALDGGLGDIFYGALGIRWTRYRFRGPGAHTLSSRGTPSPARAVSRAILDISAIPIPPASDDSSYIYNVGMIGGGTIFNAVPEQAWFTVDLRSTDPAALDRTDRQIADVAESTAQREKVKLEVERVSDNKAGGTRAALEPRRAHPLVQTAVDILNFLGVAAGRGGRPSRAIPSGSTDANVGVELGVPAISTGRAFGGDQHTLREWSDIESAYLGTKQIVLLAAAMGE